MSVELEGESELKGFVFKVRECYRETDGLCLCHCMNVTVTLTTLELATLGTSRANILSRDFGCKNYKDEKHE